MHSLAYEVYFPLFVHSSTLMKSPIVLPIPSMISGSQNSIGRQNSLTHIGAANIFSFSGLYHSSQYLMNRPTLFIKYGPSSNILSLSFRFAKITVKKPLAPNLSSICPFGLHLWRIHLDKSSSDGLYPTTCKSEHDLSYSCHIPPVCCWVLHTWVFSAP